jgi:hypothetical protein
MQQYETILKMEEILDSKYYRFLCHLTALSQPQKLCSIETDDKICL